mmetsp:Transcript_8443/g.13362  ORF Transcript_8443/g.13362 Transcript_8443/m.13362 type:complete len:222 (-) Transcript_8443:194-859(-)
MRGCTLRSSRTRPLSNLLPSVPNSVFHAITSPSSSCTVSMSMTCELVACVEENRLKGPPWKLCDGTSGKTRFVAILDKRPSRRISPTGRKHATEAPIKSRMRATVRVRLLSPTRSIPPSAASVAQKKDSFLGRLHKWQHENAYFPMSHPENPLSTPSFFRLRTTVLSRRRVVMDFRPNTSRCFRGSQSVYCDNNIGIVAGIFLPHPFSAAGPDMSTPRFIY